MVNSGEERQRWDQRYREGSHPRREPDPFLARAYAEYVQPLFPEGGSALDVAGGSGRHAVWLAQRGWKVTLVDISEVGVAQARQAAAQQHVKLEVKVADLTDSSLDRERYDLVLVFFYLQRDLFPALVSTLKPGGLLLYKTYTKEHRKRAKGPKNPCYFLEENELLFAFHKLRMLHYKESFGDEAVAELVARKEVAKR